jgi:thymidylate synthase
MSDYYTLLQEVSSIGNVIETRGLRTKELCGKVLDVEEYNLFATPVHRPFSEIWRYLKAEICWYLSGDRTLDKIRPYSKFWENIRNADGTINSNYGDLVFYRRNSHGLTSFGWALSELEKDQYTRKALVLYNDRELFFPGNKDLICNQSQQFLIRNNELICFVHLRSSDAIYGLTFNIPWWSLVHQQMFIRLRDKYEGLKLGKMQAFIASSHIYENKWNLVHNILSSPREKYFMEWIKIIPLGKDFDWYYNNLEQYFTVADVTFASK